MILQSKGRKKVKKRQKRSRKATVPEPRKAAYGHQPPQPRPVEVLDEIDPADFFDPEEFGISRNVKPLQA